MDRQVANDYMARDHMIRDLNMALDYNGKESSVTRIPVVPAICNERGDVHAGVLATLVDLASGALAARVVYPDLTATGDLRIYSTQPVKTGEVAAVGSVLRAGRAAVVIKTEIVAGIKGLSTPVGLGIATFYRLSRRDGNVEMVKDVISNQATAFRAEGPGLSEHLFDKAGLRVIDEAAGVLEIDMSTYVRNHIGALEGGMIADMADIAGQGAARAIAHKPMITCDLAMSYLSQGRVGPFYTRTEVLRISGDNVLARVEVFDRGAGDLLMAVVLNNSMAI